MSWGRYGKGRIRFLMILVQLEDSMAARPHIIDGKTVDPKRAVPRDENGSNAQKTGEANVSSKRLYLANIREEHSEASIQHYFEKYGQVEKVW